MKWKKLGQIFAPDHHYDWMVSHAANPVALHLEDDIFRIYFSGRDAKNRSSVGAVDFDIVKMNIVHEHKQQFFGHGDKNSFYADGVSIGNCYEADGTVYLLFMGWQNPTDSHWRGEIGRLIVNSDYTLKLDSESPFISTNAVDPISLSYPWVLKDKSDVYKMWYGSTLNWDAGNGEMLHVINYASSLDGHSWDRKGLAIPFEIGKAQAFSRPTVIGDLTTGYRMWFSYRSGNGEKYRIGFAVSHDGSDWELRLGSAGIETSNSGWDSEMIEYPYVFNHKGMHYMLYNGNNYGKTGFGLAIFEEDQC